MATILNNSNNIATVVESYIAPNPNATNPTPQEVNNQTQKELDKSNEQQTVTSVSQIDSKVTINNIPPDLKPQGQEKLALVLNKKRSEIKQIIIPMVVALSTQIGIKNIGTLKAKIPKTCLTKSELNEILLKRNRIVEKLNRIVKIIDVFSKILIGISLLIGITSVLIRTLKASKNTLKAAASTIPVAPPAPDGGNSLLNSVDTIKGIEEETFKKLIQISGAIAAASLALMTINAILLKIIGMLNSIDSYLKQCLPDATLTPLSDTLLELIKVNNDINQIDNQQIYNGFILEIVEEPYSPTVNRRKAVAKNTQGIILLSTPLSFTTDDQTLLNQIKLLINSNNLKAD
jgi:hypothetical protein